MTLEEISNYIEKKIEKNEYIIKFTFYELRVKKNLSESDMYYVLSLIRTKLENMGYKVYNTRQKYEYNNEICIVKDNEMLIAVKCS